ncbi:hypothetical protein QLX08_010062 [Tetragonisca angustula]|uniref:Uncharacterized protein n=1 Tax=Tetragonisca angustula TaxID=166442 RepID=A0AAW0ZDY1_9HYME
MIWIAGRDRGETATAAGSHSWQLNVPAKPFMPVHGVHSPYGSGCVVCNALVCKNVGHCPLVACTKGESVGLGPVALRLVGGTTTHAALLHAHA